MVQYLDKLIFNANGKYNNSFNIYDNNNNNFSLVTKVDNSGFNSGIGERQKISTWTQQLLEAQPKNTGLDIRKF